MGLGHALLGFRGFVPGARSAPAHPALRRAPKGASALTLAAAMGRGRKKKKKK